MSLCEERLVRVTSAIVLPLLCNKDIPPVRGYQEQGTRYVASPFRNLNHGNLIVDRCFSWNSQTEHKALPKM